MSPQAKKKLMAVLSGFGGGLAPFLVNLAQGLVNSSQLNVSLSLGYFVGVLLFGLIGAAVPLVFGEVNPRKAFFLGISAPAMISLAAKDVGKAGITTAATPFYVALVASAYAQTSPTPAATTPVRALQIELNGTMPEATVVFQDDNGRELRAATLQAHHAERLTIPAAATSLEIRYGDSVTKPYPLLTLAVDVQFVQVTGNAGKKQFDIQAAFTGRPKILYDIKVAPPPVYLQIAAESQRELAVSIQKSLETHGFSAPGVENVAAKGGFIPDLMEVRYLRYPEDKSEAEAILQILKTEHRITNCRISYTEKGPRGQPGQVEVWFSKTVTTDGS